MLFMSLNTSESVAGILPLHLVFIHGVIKVQHSKSATFVDRHYLCPRVGANVYCVGPDLS